MTSGFAPRIVITGTDTDVGKTVFAAGLVAVLDGSYWKPVQAGLDAETDSEIVRRLSGLSRERVLPEVYRFSTAASPHLAAERDGVEIESARPCNPGVEVKRGHGRRAKILFRPRPLQGKARPSVPSSVVTAERRRSDRRPPRHSRARGGRSCSPPR